VAAVPFEIPDTIAALPRLPFEFSPAAPAEAAAILALEPAELFHRLLRDQESEAVLLASRRILAAFFGAERLAAARHDTLPHDADGIAAAVTAVREELAAALAPLDGVDAEVRHRVLRERAPLGLVAGCWLDMLSQPATQPAICVNRLVAHEWELRGAGNPRRSLHHARRRQLERAGIDLPQTGAADFLRTAGARPLTALHATFYVALSRLPANFIPEVVGIHYVFFALAADDLLHDTEPMLAEPALRAMLAEYLAIAGEAERDRLRAAIRLAIDLEREHAGLLVEIATWLKDLPLESKVAEIVRRHAPMAGSQHGRVRVGGQRLAEAFKDPALDVAAFLTAFRESPYVRPDRGGNAPFIQAMKFGGPMFGIFDDAEAATFKAWVASVQAGERPAVSISLDRTGDAAAAGWSAAIAAAAPDDVVIAEPPTACGDRELFYRLVNVENFASMLDVAKRRAEERFAAAEILFTHGTEGRFTDASWFDYSPEALFERGERVYWDKLVDPYQPLAEIPDRDEVIFAQSTYALASLIDGTWIHRVGNLGHRERDSDEAIYAIYADEMGHGDLRKNHLTLVHRLLASMEIRMPHIRDAAFMDQRDLPDELYGASLHQMCMALHPDTFYNEILGYNFAIEMFGSGEFRLHEIQKLRHHGFDDCYEQAHLAIDNFSSGHTRQAADIIVSHLDHVRRTVGEAAVAGEWRRIWRGYASYAWFVEAPLVKRLLADAEAALAGAGAGAGGGGGEDLADLVL
jgi:hypothetical protein